MNQVCIFCNARTSCSGDDSYTAIIWGWTHFAGVISLMWAGLLRPGELLAATRADLLLGDKALPFGLLSFEDPKNKVLKCKAAVC